MNTAPKLPDQLLAWNVRNALGPYNDDDIPLLDLIILLRNKIAALAPPSGEGVMCGGCGNSDPSKPCVGCRHDFGGAIIGWRLVDGVRVYDTVSPDWAKRGEHPTDWINELGTLGQHPNAMPHWVRTAIKTIYHGLTTTPPPASQERDGDREVLLYLMQQFDCETWECEQCGHSEDCKTMDSAEYLRSYLAASPPSSAAEASINPPEIDSKLIPDAPEQAKPTGDDAIREQYRDGTFTRYFGAHPSEQAQAGELPTLPEETEFSGGKNFCCPIHYGYTADQMREYANACRLAGGVTSLPESGQSIDDAYWQLIYAVARKYPNETRHETALRYILERESASSSGSIDALVAAWGAK